MKEKSLSLDDNEIWFGMKAPASVPIGLLRRRLALSNSLQTLFLCIVASRHPKDIIVTTYETAANIEDGEAGFRRSEL